MSLSHYDQKRGSGLQPSLTRVAGVPCRPLPIGARAGVWWHPAGMGLTSKDKRDMLKLYGLSAIMEISTNTFRVVLLWQQIARLQKHTSVSMAGAQSTAQLES